MSVWYFLHTKICLIIAVKRIFPSPNTPKIDIRWGFACFKRPVCSRRGGKDFGRKGGGTGKRRMNSALVVGGDRLAGRGRRWPWIHGNWSQMSLRFATSSWRPLAADWMTVPLSSTLSPSASHGSFNFNEVVMLNAQIVQHAACHDEFRHQVDVWQCLRINEWKNNKWADCGLWYCYCSHRFFKHKMWLVM